MMNPARLINGGKRGLSQLIALAAIGCGGTSLWAAEAEIVDGDLVILGSAGDDRLAVTLEGTEVVVASLDGTTLVNGQLEDRFDATALVGDLVADLADGDNALAVGGEAHEEDVLSIITAAPAAEDGHDDDHEEEARLTIPGDLMVRTQADLDTIQIRFVQIGGSVTVATGGGPDVVDIGRGPGFAEHEEHSDEALATALANEVLLAIEAEEDEEECADGGPPPDVRIGGRLTIRTNAGDDAIKVGFTQIGERLVIASGTGADQVVTGRGPIRGVHGSGGCEGDDPTGTAAATAADDEGSHDDGSGGGGHSGRPPDVRVAGDTTVSIGPGADFLMMRNLHVAGDLSASAASGGVQMGSQNLRVEGKTTLAGGNGGDDFALLDSRFTGPVRLDSGPGVDLVFIDNSQIGGVTDVALGSFNDRVVLRDNTFNAPVLLQGGSGRDGAAWNNLGNTFFQPPQLKQFEYSNINVSAIAAYLVDEETGFGLFLQGRSAGH
jgi:hypothetical protein